MGFFLANPFHFWNVAEPRYFWKRACSFSTGMWKWLASGFLTSADETGSEKRNELFWIQWLGTWWGRRCAFLVPHFKISMSSLEFHMAVFAGLAVKFCFRFMGLVFAVLPRRLDNGKVRASLSWQVMASASVGGHVNCIRSTASGWGLWAPCPWGCWSFRTWFYFESPRKKRKKLTQLTDA